jgi:hypothetical protein
MLSVAAHSDSAEFPYQAQYFSISYVNFFGLYKWPSVYVWQMKLAFGCNAVLFNQRLPVGKDVARLMNFTFSELVFICS